MNILLIGSGGREHALAWKIRQSTLLKRLVVAPGNPGIARVAEVRPVQPTDVTGLVALAREIKADLVVVGPESSLEVGIADLLAQSGIPCFGPTAQAAKLETSKAFTKEFCTRWEIPTAGYGVFDTAEAAFAYLSPAEAALCDQSRRARRRQGRGHFRRSQGRRGRDRGAARGPLRRPRGW